MATLPIQRAGIAGTTLTMAAASGGGDLVNGAPHVALLVQNGGGSPITVTVAIPGKTKSGADEPDVAITVAAGAKSVIAIPADFENIDDHLVHITYSGVTTVTVAAIEV